MISHYSLKMKNKKVYYCVRWLHNPLTLGDRLYMLKTKVRHFFTKWAIVNTDNNSVIPFGKLYFLLSDSEKEAAEKIYKKHGTIEYVFYPLGGLGWGTKVRVLKSGEEFDITDLDNI